MLISATTNPSVRGAVKRPVEAPQRTLAPIPASPSLPTALVNYNLKPATPHINSSIQTPPKRIVEITNSNAIGANKTLLQENHSDGITPAPLPRNKLLKNKENEALQSKKSYE
jgi:hypothetical protein